MGVFLSPEHRQRIADHNGNRRGFHAARRRSGRAADQHQHDNDELRRFTHHGQICGVESRRSRRDRLKQRFQNPLSERQCLKLKRKKYNRRNHKKHRCCRQNDFALHPVSTDMPLVDVNIIPGQKSDAADNNQRHNCQRDCRIVRIGGQGGKLPADTHQIKAGVAERRDRMKQSHPDSPYSEIPAENRSHQDGSDQLKHQRQPDDKPGQPDNAADLRRRDRFLHRTALHERNLAAGNHGK